MQPQFVLYFQCNVTFSQLEELITLSVVVVWYSEKIQNNSSEDKHQKLINSNCMWDFCQVTF